MKTKSIGLLVVALTALSLVACANGNSRIERTLPLEPGGQFELQSDAGSVTVTGSSASGAKIVITSNRDDLQSLFNFDFSSSDGVAQVTVRKKSFQWFSHANLHFEVTVPTQTRVEVKTGGGSIHIDGVTGRTDTHTSGGSIHATLARGNSQGGELETSGGSIRLGLDPAANLDIDASTSGGSVSTDLPVRVVGTISRSKLQGTLGSGGPTLRLHTSGGSIRISSD